MPEAAGKFRGCSADGRDYGNKAVVREAARPFKSAAEKLFSKSEGDETFLEWSERAGKPFRARPPSQGLKGLAVNLDQPRASEPDVSLREKNVRSRPLALSSNFEA